MNHVINQALVDKIQISYINVPVAVFLIGANGSGKSTFRNYLNLSEIQTNIDNDILNLIFKKKFPDTYITKAEEYGLMLYQEGISSGLNLCIEETIVDIDASIKRMQLARQKGYFILGYLIGLNNVELNIERIKQRTAKGGHSIAEATIRQLYSDSTSNFLQVKDFFNELHVIDNSEDGYKLQLSKDGDNLTRHASKLENWVVDILRFI